MVRDSVFVCLYASYSSINNFFTSSSCGGDGDCDDSCDGDCDDSCDGDCDDSCDGDCDDSCDGDCDDSCDGDCDDSCDGVRDSVFVCLYASYSSINNFFTSSIALAGTALIVMTDINKRLRIKIADLLISIMTGGGGLY